jgi:hypothetical protein
MRDTCVRFSVFVLSYIYVEALRRADHPYKESYRLQNDQETEKSALCSKWEQEEREREKKIRSMLMSCFNVLYG